MKKTLHIISLIVFFACIGNVAVFGILETIIKTKGGMVSADMVEPGQCYIYVRGKYAPVSQRFAEFMDWYEPFTMRGFLVGFSVMLVAVVCQKKQGDGKLGSKPEADPGTAPSQP